MMDRGVDVVGVRGQVRQVGVVGADLGVDCASRYVRVYVGTVLPSPDVGVSNMTRGLRMASVVCHDTITSVAAFLPNCRCRPPTGGALCRSDRGMYP